MTGGDSDAHYTKAFGTWQVKFDNGVRAPLGGSVAKRNRESMIGNSRDRALVEGLR